jgi:hypothetical protein
MMPQAHHRLEPGDRFPEFMLADQTGTMRAFSSSLRLPSSLTWRTTGSAVLGAALYRFR